MEKSSTPFTDLLSTNLAANTENRQEIPQQQIPGYPPPHLHMNFPPQHYGYQPHHPQNYMPFGGQGSYQHSMAGPQPSYQQLMASGSYLGAPYQGSVGQYPQANLGGGMFGGPSSPAGSSIFFGAAGGSSSRCDDSSSPMSSTPYSPISPACPSTQQAGVMASMPRPSSPGRTPDHRRRAAAAVSRRAAFGAVDVGVLPVEPRASSPVAAVTAATSHGEGPHPRLQYSGPPGRGLELVELALLARVLAGGARIDPPLDFSGVSRG